MITEFEKQVFDKMVEKGKALQQHFNITYGSILISDNTYVPQLFLNGVTIQNEILRDTRTENKIECKVNDIIVAVFNINFTDYEYLLTWELKDLPKDIKNVNYINILNDLNAFQKELRSEFCDMMQIALCKLNKTHSLTFLSEKENQLLMEFGTSYKLSLKISDSDLVVIDAISQSGDSLTIGFDISLSKKKVSLYKMSTNINSAEDYLKTQGIVNNITKWIKENM